MHFTVVMFSFPEQNFINSDHNFLQNAQVVCFSCNCNIDIRKVSNKKSLQKKFNFNIMDKRKDLGLPESGTIIKIKIPWSFLEKQTLNNSNDFK